MTDKLPPTRFPDTITPRPAHKGRAPNIVIIPRSEDGHDAGPNDGSQYFGIDRKFNLPPHCGKAQEPKRERLWGTAGPAP